MSFLQVAALALLLRALLVSNPMLRETWAPLPDLQVRSFPVPCPSQMFRGLFPLAPSHLLAQGKGLSPRPYHCLSWFSQLPTNSDVEPGEDCCPLPAYPLSLISPGKAEELSCSLLHSQQLELCWVPNMWSKTLARRRRSTESCV